MVKAGSKGGQGGDFDNTNRAPWPVRSGKKWPRCQIQPAERMKRPCHIVWRKEKRIGIGVRLRSGAHFHGTTGSIERCQTQGTGRFRRSCHSKNRDHAGPCSARALTGFAFMRSNIFSDARRATAGSTRAILWIEDHEGPLPHPAQDGMQ